jgi:hypothetical protein
MWNKQAVWCQLASLTTATLALSAFFSIQPLTWQQDIYWSAVLGWTTLVHFAVGEHRRVAGLSLDSLVTGANCWSNIVDVVIVHGVFLHWVPHHCLWIVGAGLVLGSLPQRPYWVALTLCRSPDQLGLLVVLRVLARRWRRQELAATVGQTLASSHLQKATALQAGGICIEALLLWQLRCHHRFPHRYRWTPVLCSAVVTSCATLWCQLYVAPTLVSHRSLIKSTGHGLTPSLNAIKSCPTCAACLTCLDIEDVFE